MIQPHYEAGKRAIAAAHTVFGTSGDSAGKSDTNIVSQKNVIGAGGTGDPWELPPGVPDYQEDAESTGIALKLKTSMQRANRKLAMENSRSTLSWMPQRFDSESTGLRLDTEIVIGTVKLTMRNLFHQYVFPYNTSNVDPIKAPVSLAAFFPSVESGEDGESALSHARLDALAQLRRPLQVSPSEIAVMQSDILRWFPLESLPTLPERYQSRVTSLLRSAVVTRLIGLLSHYGYWVLMRKIQSYGPMVLPDIAFTEEVCLIV